MIDHTTLERLPIFAELNAAARREVALRAVLRTFLSGEVLWTEGATARGLFVVIDGEVRVVRRSKGRQHVIHTERQGGTLGEVPLFAGGVYPATAVAARRTTCLVVGEDAILAATREDPWLALALLSRLATRVRELVHRMDRLAARTVTARLATFLLERSRSSASSIITLGRTQHEVAEELGTVREVIARSLGEMRKAGIIRAAGRGGYEIVDRKALEDEAGR